MKYNTIINITNDSIDTTVKLDDEMYNALITIIRSGIASGHGEIISTKSQPKTKKTTKPKAETKKPTKTKPVAKVDKSFDREKYLETAKKLGCLGAKGVWKCARPVVYKVMDGDMTLKAGKAEIQSIVAKNGWDK